MLSGSGGSSSFETNHRALCDRDHIWQWMLIRIVDGMAWVDKESEQCTVKWTKVNEDT